MKNIKDNPTLSLDSLEKIIGMINIDLLVSPFFEKEALELTKILGKRFTKDNKHLLEKGFSEKEILEIFNFNIFIRPNLKEFEWILINTEDIYYSKGDNTL